MTTDCPLTFLVLMQFIKVSNCINELHDKVLLGNILRQVATAYLSKLKVTFYPKSPDVQENEYLLATKTCSVF